jgi:predicted Zn-dependent protease
MQAASEEFTPEIEYNIGRAVAAQLVAKYGAYENPEATEYVNLLGTTLAYFCDLPETYGGYHFLILDTLEINCIAAPGGFILITRGMFRVTTNEEMLAAILAYSISHVVLRTGIESIRNQRQTEAIIAVVEMLMQNSESHIKIDTDSQKAILANTMNEKTDAQLKKQVMSADAMAVRILYKAGYNWLALKDALVALNDFPAVYSDRFLSIDARIANIEGRMLGFNKPTPTESFIEVRRKRFAKAMQGILEVEGRTSTDGSTE